MASGRRDYWNALDSGKSIFGVYQTPIFALANLALAATSTDDTTVYTVPAGYVMNITNLSVSCNRPGINFLLVKVGADEHIYQHFDFNTSLPFAADGIIQADEGEAIVFWITNNDSVENDFYMVVLGYIIPKGG